MKIVIGDTPGNLYLPGESASVTNSHMILSFLPREGKFFDLFDQSCDLIVASTEQFSKMLGNLKERERSAEIIKEIEKKCDEVTHSTVELLHKTFITPLDRNEIYSLITKMDDIVDLVEAASQRICLFDVQSIPPEGAALAKVCLESAEMVRSAVRALKDLKSPKAILEKCIEINRLENDADSLLRTALAKLFREEPDTRVLIKLKEIFEILESVTDRCEDVANIVESIVLENS